MATQDLSNLVINARFLLQRKIGVGGMATVYEALDIELDKRVAVKVLNPEWRSDEEQVGRFRQEARTAARVQHPHLVDVTDRGISAEGIPYLVMEYLEGKNLHEELCDRPGPMPWRRVVGLSVQVCAALTVAHEQGLVHRDIKPGNCFLVTRPGQPGDFVKLLDLGIAKVVAGPRDPHAPPSTRTHQGMPGTPEFMAPEQVLGVPVDARTDLYALGVMMFRMLTGRQPFTAARGEPPWKVLDMHVNKPPPSPRSVAPDADIPESVDEIVMRCLAKQPDDRWNSAAELAEALLAAERAELMRTSEAVSASGAQRTAWYPVEARSSPSQRWLRVLSFLQGCVLFSLSAMTMLMVDLPGVEALAAWLQDSPAPPVPPGRRALEAAPEPTATPVATPESPAPASAVATPPVAEPDAASPQAVWPAGAETGPEPEPARPEPVPEVAEPSVPPTPAPVEEELAEPLEQPKPSLPKPQGEPRRPKPPPVADPFAGSPDPGAEVRRAIAKAKFHACEDYVEGGATFEISVVLAEKTGKVKSATVKKGVKPRADACVKGALEKMKFPKVTQGGEFSAMVKL